MILCKVFNSWCIVDLNKYEVSAMYGQQDYSFVLAEGDQYFFSGHVSLNQKNIMV